MINNKENKLICPYCENFISKTAQGFAIHLNRKHNKKFYEYILENELNNKWPLCKCDCGEKVPLVWHDTKFGEFILGHNGKYSFLGKHHSQETKDKISKVQIGRPLSISHKENISKGVTKCYLEGRFQHKCGSFFSKKNNKTFYFRSSWEEKFMNILEYDETVLKYDYESIAIKYEQNSTIKRYIPDFIVFYKDGVIKMIEIGQKNLKFNDEKEILKIKAVKEYCKKRK
jgi:hypothetical protein